VVTVGQKAEELLKSVKAAAREYEDYSWGLFWKFECKQFNLLKNEAKVIIPFCRITTMASVKRDIRLLKF